MDDWTAAGKAKYKQIRTRFWLGFALLWGAGWYLLLESTIGARQAAQDATCASSGGSFFCGGGSGNSAVVGVLIWIAMAVVVLTSPLMLLPARYAARRCMAYAEAREIQREAQEEAALRRRLQEESRQRIAHSEAEAAEARGKSSRSEIIMKLGSISDLADLLDVEQDSQRRMNIRLGVAQALRELLAKYDTAALGALIRSDEAARVSARSVIERLGGSSLADLAELGLVCERW